jgi:peptidoglycan/LPS O-acetylase OafA/YrhL
MNTTSTKSPEKPYVFGTLDALRGVAAIAVMAFHYAALLGGNVFPHGYLAVDFFFVLSGFVLAFAYQDRLEKGWSTGSFLLTRLARLYPLYFAGLILGFLFSLLQSHFGRTHLSETTTLLTLLTSLLLVPAFGLKQQAHESTIYPYNRPAWSLFFEILANVFHALLLRRRGWKFLAGTLCLTGIAFLYSCRKLGTLDFGVMRSTIPYGLSRVLFSYTAGVIMLRIWRSGRVTVRVSPLIPAILLLAALTAPLPQRFALPYDLAITFFVFPILVLIGASSQPGSGLTKQICELLGTASYAIYVLHGPVRSFFGEILNRVMHRPPHHFAPWAGIACMLLSIGLALLLDKFYDLRVRAFLRKKLVGGSTASAIPAEAGTVSQARDGMDERPVTSPAA